MAAGVSDDAPAGGDVAALLPPPPRTWFDDVWDSIVTPGAGPGLVAALNASILALLLVVGGYTLSVGADTHLLVMAALATGLLLSANWYMSQIRSLPLPTVAAEVPSTPPTAESPSPLRRRG